MSITKAQAKTLKSSIDSLILAEVENSWKGVKTVEDRLLVEAYLANARLQLDTILIFLTEKEKT